MAVSDTAEFGRWRRLIPSRYNKNRIAPCAMPASPAIHPTAVSDCTAPHTNSAPQIENHHTLGQYRTPCSTILEFSTVQ
eukprot:2357388-Rhodomonas_salina.1